MPTDYTIPAKLEKRCEPCEFHKCTGSLHIRTGGGYREYSCTHPEAFEPTDSTIIAELNGRLKQMDGGRYIGRTETRPDWCPLKRDEGQEVQG